MISPEIPLDLQVYGGYNNSFPNNVWPLQTSSQSEGNADDNYFKTRFEFDSNICNYGSYVHGNASTN